MRLFMLNHAPNEKKKIDMLLNPVILKSNPEAHNMPTTAIK